MTHFISSDNHDIRKALCLSGDEIMVLVQIIRLSGTVDFPKMVMSKANLADRVDMSPRRIFEILNALEDKGYIVRHKDGIVPSKEIRALDESFNGQTSFFIQNDGFAIASGKQMVPKGRAKKEPKPRIPDPNPPQQDDPTVQILHTDYAESAHLPMQNLHTNILIEVLSKDLSMSSSEKTDSDGGGEPDPDSGGDNPHLPAIPEDNPNPQVAPAPLPLRRGTHPAFPLLVEAQDAWLKGRGHAGVKMDGKQGKTVKAMIPRIEAQLRAEEDDPSPEAVAGYLKWIHGLHHHMPKFEQGAMLDFASLWLAWTKIVECANETCKKNPLLKRKMEIDNTLKYYQETQGDQTANVEAFAKAFGTTENPEMWKDSYFAAQGRSLLRWPGYSPVNILRKKAEQYREDCQTKRMTQKGPKRWLDEDGWVVKYGSAPTGRVSK